MRIVTIAKPRCQCGLSLGEAAPHRAADHVHAVRHAAVVDAVEVDVPVMEILVLLQLQAPKTARDSAARCFRGRRMS